MEKSWLSPVQGTVAFNRVVPSGPQYGGGNHSGAAITATTPSHSSGAVNVVVTNTDGQKGTLTSGYTYSKPALSVTSITPDTGPDAGGSGVTISGANFSSGTTSVEAPRRV
jgi:IPT/TIG domain-containing protein